MYLSRAHSTHAYNRPQAAHSLDVNNRNPSVRGNSSGDKSRHKVSPLSASVYVLRHHQLGPAVLGFAHSQRLGICPKVELQQGSLAVISHNTSAQRPR